MSTSRRSARRCLRTTPWASAAPFGVMAIWRELRTMRSSASRRSSISETEGAALPSRSARRAWITGIPSSSRAKMVSRYSSTGRMEAVQHAVDPTGPGLPPFRVRLPPGEGRARRSAALPRPACRPAAGYRGSRGVQPQARSGREEARSGRPGGARLLRRGRAAGGRRRPGGRWRRVGAGGRRVGWGGRARRRAGWGGRRAGRGGRRCRTRRCRRCRRCRGRRRRRAGRREGPPALQQLDEALGHRRGHDRHRRRAQRGPPAPAERSAVRDRGAGGPVDEDNPIQLHFDPDSPEATVAIIRRPAAGPDEPPPS